MCGRFTLTTSASHLAQHFLPGVDLGRMPKMSPRYNIAPTQPVVCILQNAGDKYPGMDSLRWGLIPSWAKDLSIGYKTINARGETVAEKPSFRSAFRGKRCLVLADGYYEWKKSGKQKQTIYFSATNNQPIAFAGLWEVNRSLAEDGGSILSCTIITTAANKFASDVHDRMPVILPRDNWQLWLDPTFNNVAQLQTVLLPAPNDFLKRDEVSSFVNNVRNEGAQCLERA